MTTAIDTNILIDVLLPDPAFHEISAAAIAACVVAGPLVVCDAVYAELSAHFLARRDCDQFLADLQIRVEPLSLDALFLAGRTLAAYRKRGKEHTRVLADFLVGAHAQAQAACLLSRDRGFYRRYFASLKLLDPSKSGRLNK